MGLRPACSRITDTYKITPTHTPAALVERKGRACSTTEIKVKMRTRRTWRGGQRQWHPAYIPRCHRFCGTALCYAVPCFPSAALQSSLADTIHHTPVSLLSGRQRMWIWCDEQSALLLSSSVAIMHCSMVLHGAGFTLVRYLGCKLTGLHSTGSHMLNTAASRGIVPVCFARAWGGYFARPRADPEPGADPRIQQQRIQK